MNVLVILKYTSVGVVRRLIESYWHQPTFQRCGLRWKSLGWVLVWVTVWHRLHEYLYKCVCSRWILNIGVRQGRSYHRAWAEIFLDSQFRGGTEGRGNRELSSIQGGNLVNEGFSPGASLGNFWAWGQFPLIGMLLTNFWNKKQWQYFYRDSIERTSPNL